MGKRNIQTLISLHRVSSYALSKFDDALLTRESQKKNNFLIEIAVVTDRKFGFFAKLRFSRFPEVSLGEVESGVE